MEENEKYTQESMTALEAILFAAAAPVPYGRLSETLGLKSEVIQEMCRTLSNDYERRGAGIRMQFMNAQVQLTTAPEVSSAAALPKTDEEPPAASGDARKPEPAHDRPAARFRGKHEKPDPEEESSTSSWYK